MANSGGSTFAQSPGSGIRRHSYEFGPYRFDVPNHRLLRAGAPVTITPKCLDLLLMLLRHRDRVVGKAELMQALWADTAVEDANLTQQVFTLRRILSEGDETAYIETVPRRGYRLAVDVRETDEPSPTAARHRIRAAAAVVVLAAVIAGGFAVRQSWQRELRQGLVTVAVLPFEYPGRPPARPNAEIDFTDALAIGIPDAIITRLSSVRQFRVRPTQAVSRYYGQTVDLQEVGRRLQAAYVLAGTIRTAGDRVRVSAQLVRTLDGSPVWGRQYDTARADVLGIEDDVAEAIATALRVQISDAERERLYRRYTQNGAAYERYLKGRARLRAVTEQDTLQAIAEFEAARDLDPDYALAYAGLATAAAQLRVRFDSPQGEAVWDARASQEAGRALQLEPDLAEAHVAIAAVHRFQEYDWDTVIRESRRALELNPSLDTPHVYIAVAYFHLGLLDDAEREVRLARELNPENRVEPLEVLGAVSLFAGRTAEAATWLSQLHDLTDSRIVRYLLGWTLYYEGDPDGAERLLASMIDDEGPLPGNARATLAAIRAARGAKAEARSLAGRVASDRTLIHHGAYGLGTAYAQLNDPAAAVRWLAQAAATGFSCYPWYARDPLLDPIRNDRQFMAFMQDLERSWEHARAKYSGSASGGG